MSFRATASEKNAEWILSNTNYGVPFVSTVNKGQVGAVGVPFVSMVNKGQVGAVICTGVYVFFGQTQLAFVYLAFRRLALFSFTPRRAELRGLTCSRWGIGLNPTINLSSP